VSRLKKQRALCPQYPSADVNSCSASAEGAAAATTVSVNVSAINPSSPAGSAVLQTSPPQTTCLVLPTHFLFLWSFHDSLLTTEVKLAFHESVYRHTTVKITNKFHLLTYLLTPWSRVPLEKLTSKLCS
jgi:hypothetical protein